MPLGGYVEKNGITLCQLCHYKAEQFHALGKAVKNYAPEDLYKKIGSSYQQALEASKKLK